MKKYKYKLEALVKLKKFKEATLRSELGQINQEIGAVEQQIKNLETNIDAIYSDQEEVLASESSGQMAQFYPRYIEGQREEIKNKESLLYALKMKYKKKLQELSYAMNETKIMTKMKEKDFIAYKKELRKKEEMALEELNTINRMYREEQS